MAKRKRYTQEERAERNAADRALCAAARDLLVDPDAVTSLVGQLTTESRSPKVLSYSLRNQALLATQAEARGIALTDVDTFRGWIERGRCVRRGEKGLRIVVPKGTESGGDAETEQTSTNQEEQTEEGGDEETRTRFRMTPVFDISQTDGVEDAETIGEAYEAPNPSALLADTLTHQLEKFGYEIEEDADIEHADVDDGNLVTVPTGRPVTALARALAIVVTAYKTSSNPSSVIAA